VNSRDVTSWRCANCSRAVDSPCCPQCGEEAPQKRDLSLRGLAVELFHALTDLDGRLLRSFRLLLFRPGALTVVYADGVRKPYFGPIQLFLVVNLLFFALQSVTSQKVFSTSLASHLHKQDWSALATGLTTARLAQRGLTLAVYAPVFDHAVAANAKSMVILMAVPFTLLLPLLFLRSGRPFAAQIVFALHFYSFLLLVFCATLLVLLVDGWAGGTQLDSAAMDTGLFVALLTSAACYLYVAVGRVHGARGLGRLLAVAALVAAVGIAVPAYRFVLFLITLYTT
jgi:hypothetical protein